MATLPKSRLRGFPAIAALTVLIIVAGVFGYRSWGAARVDQPIRFNHKLHVSTLQIECSQCHTLYQQGAHSGLPDGEICQACHSEAQGKNPEEAKLRGMLGGGQRLVFRKLFHLPTHVFYSHRRHAVLGKLECSGCHGNIAETEAPPPRPLVQISMDFCTDCHTKKKVSNDCKSCHR